MRLVNPTVEVPNDRADGIMARSGQVRGFDRTHVVWVFGFMPDSDAARAYGVDVGDDRGFLWVLATLRTGKVKSTFRGYAVEMPSEYVRVLEANV